MKLVVGLGNPGRKYEATRHNVGFRVIDELGRRWVIDVSRQRFSGLMGDGLIGQQKVILLKPMTYMNCSGKAVLEAMTFYKLTLDDVLVISDDMALPVGRLRLRRSGSAGGHNGLSDVIEAVDSKDFCRLRIGIEGVEGQRMVSHVLSPFQPAEQKLVQQSVERSADTVECWLTEGPESAMNRFNPADGDGPNGK